MPAIAALLNDEVSDVCCSAVQTLRARATLYYGNCKKVQKVMSES